MAIPDAFLWPFALLMAATTAVLIQWAAESRTAIRGGLVAFLLLMMAAMFVGAVFYFSDPGTAGLVQGLWAGSALMSISVVPLFVGFLSETRRQLELGPGVEAPARPTGRLFALTIVLLVLLNELLMGWTFLLAAGASPGSLLAGSAGVLNPILNITNSPWFLFTMALEMALSVLLLRARLSRALQVVLLGQSAIMFFSPLALAGTGAWVTVSVCLSSALMTGLFVYFMEFIYRHRGIPGPFASYLIRLLAVYALMMAGLFAWLYYGSGSLFAVSILAEMVVFYEAVVRPERTSGGSPMLWQGNPRWAFELLGLIFIAELFMGAALSVQIDPAEYLGGFPFLALSGPAGTIAANAVSNVFWFVATVTASTGFLLMMGVEMGALVAFKFRETRSRETRLRLGLMMGSYAAFAVFYPSIYYGLAFPHALSGTAVPVLGWNMGIGSAPLAAGVFTVLLVSYSITGILTFLFGRRAICSVFCSAPLMFQGTAIDSMKSFNRSSPIARKYLSSRLSNTYTATSGVVMASLVVASVLSYLNTTGTLSLYIQGSVDPTVFLFTFYFGVLWYVMFVTIPYTGSYNCVTMGWCYTGTFAQFFHKLGPFKLKVWDRDVCKSCTTLDCAKSCPVGLTDMPGHFRQKGEFRSTKCCGVGDCVEACPYGNMYIFDARHWLRERLGLPAVRKPSGALPMARPHASRTLGTAPVRRVRAEPAASAPAPAASAQGP